MEIALLTPISIRTLNPTQVGGSRRRLEPLHELTPRRKPIEGRPFTAEYFHSTHPQSTIPAKISIQCSNPAACGGGPMGHPPPSGGGPIIQSPRIKFLTPGQEHDRSCQSRSRRRHRGPPSHQHQSSQRKHGRQKHLLPRSEHSQKVVAPCA